MSRDNNTRDNEMLNVQDITEKGKKMKLEGKRYRIISNYLSED